MLLAPAPRGARRECCSARGACRAGAMNGAAAEAEPGGHKRRYRALKRRLKLLVYVRGGAAGAGRGGGRRCGPP